MCCQSPRARVSPCMLRRWEDWTQTMSAHDFSDPFKVRWHASLEAPGDLTEVLRAEQPGDDHAQLPGVLRIQVREVVHMLARYEQDVARSHTHLLAIQNPRHDAVQS